MARKRVVAVFWVDTDEDGKKWHKSDVALAIDCHEAFGDDPEAVVWDSVEDFVADCVGVCHGQPVIVGV